MPNPNAVTYASKYISCINSKIVINPYCSHFWNISFWKNHRESVQASQKFSSKQVIKKLNIQFIKEKKLGRLYKDIGAAVESIAVFLPPLSAS